MNMILTLLQSKSNPQPLEKRLDSLQKVIDEMKLNKNVEMIKAISSSWPFLLSISAIILTVILLIFYKRRIGVVFSRFKIFRGSIAGANLELVRSEESLESAPETSLALPQTDLNPEQQADTIDGNTEIANNDKPSLYSVYLLLKNGQKNEAEKELAAFQLEAESLEKREQNQIFYYSLAYENGFPEGVEELQKIADGNGLIVSKIRSLKSLSRIYTKNSQFEKSISTSQKAIELSVSNGEKSMVSDIIIDMFDAYKGQSKTQEYIQLIFKQIEAEKKDPVLFKLYTQLAEAYKTLNMLHEEAVFLIKANEYFGNDKNLLFKTAFALSNQGENELAIHYYQISEYLDNKQSYVLNNMAVAYDSIEVPTESYKKLKESMDLGNTLAASNIANKYITLGMHSQALEILDTFKQQSADLHGNVWKSYDKIQVNKKRDEERIEKAKKDAMEINNFYRKYADTIVNSIDHSFDLSLCNTSNPQINFLEETATDCLKFEYKNQEFRLTFQLDKKGHGKCTAEVKSRYLSYYTDQYSGHYYFAKDELHFYLAHRSSREKDLLSFLFVDMTS